MIGLWRAPDCTNDHEWVEDDAFTPLEFDDQFCCKCGIYRVEV